MYTQFFGTYLLSGGYVTPEQLFSAMQRQSKEHIKLGTLAIHAGYMTADSAPYRQYLPDAADDSVALCTDKI